METGKTQNHSTTVQSLQTRYLCFSLGQEEFAVPLLTVREVLGMPEITPVPHTPSYFLGIMNLRGQVISVVDLRAKLTIKANPSTETAVIICQLNTTNIGVVVDSVNSVLSPELDQLSERPEVPQSKARDCIDGVYRKESRLVLLLNINKLLNVDEAAAKTARVAA